MMNASKMGTCAQEPFPPCYESTHGVTESNIEAVFVVDLTDEQTFAPEILTAEDVRRLLGIPRADRWCVAGDGTEK